MRRHSAEKDNDKKNTNKDSSDIKSVKLLVGKNN
jgi:hypothetical protein